MAISRRDLLKIASSAGGALMLPNVTGLLGAGEGPYVGRTELGSADRGRTETQSTLRTVTPPAMTPGRERLLADFGWRFHLGHANDPAADFGYGRTSGSGAFAKAGSLLAGGGRGNPSP